MTPPASHDFDAAGLSSPPPSSPRLVRDGASRSGREGDGAALLELARARILADAASLQPLEDLNALVVLVYLDAGALRIVVVERAGAGCVFWRQGARRALEALNAVEVPPGEIATIALFLDGEKRAALTGSAPWPRTKKA